MEKILISLIIIILSFSFSLERKVEITHWKVSKESVVEILGKTNVNQFECAALGYQGNDILIETLSPEKHIAHWSGEIVLNSTNFNCYNKLMTKDFHETVRAEEHPEIRVRFLDLVRTNPNTPSESLKGNVEITLAGVCRRFPISCQLQIKQNGKTTLSGKQTVTFSDFSINPPVKFFGTVKVQNEIQVQFGLVLEQI
jgi:hypothetical protein